MHILTSDLTLFNVSLMDPMRRNTMLKAFRADLVAAHEFFFESRHPFPSAPFHEELVSDWYSPAPRIIQEAFRGAAKSTKAEEALALMAAFGDFKNGVIIKANETRAKESLTAIKTIFTTNDLIIEFFGDMLGPVTSETKLVLANNVCVHAVGKRQSLRGTKHNSFRPDLLMGDDMEDEEDVKTKEAHDKFMKWLYAEVFPSLQQPFNRVRIIGTPLADEKQCMVARLVKSPSWQSRIIPIRYYNDGGELVSAWPEVYPIEKIAGLEYEYRREGRYETFAREYLVQSTPTEGQTFDSSMFRVTPMVRTWQATFAAFDPARTTSAKAAFTGWAAWSIFGSRIHVWEAGGAHLAPDEIRDKIFEINDRYNPVLLGVEKDGLELFLMQPLRAEMLKRGIMLPLKELRAPRDRGKEAFLEGLQPFAKAKEITLNEPMEELIGQFISFPKGRNDIINALAYALIMRGGAPVYDFQEASIDEDLSISAQAPVYILFNSNGAYVSAVVCQYHNGYLAVLSDYLVEGSPAEVFPDLFSRVNLEVRTSSNGRVQIKYVAPAEHFAVRDLVGLRAAARRAQVALGQGGQQIKGRVKLQELLRQSVRNRMAVRVSPFARYTLRGFTGGYYKVPGHDGMVNVLAEQNIYSIVMESLESFAAALQALDRADEGNIRTAVSVDGRTYITSRP